MSVKFEIIFITTKVETKHRIAWNLARIARKFTCSTKIEIQMLEEKLARWHNIENIEVFRADSGAKILVILEIGHEIEID